MDPLLNCFTVVYTNLITKFSSENCKENRGFELLRLPYDDRLTKIYSILREKTHF